MGTCHVAVVIDGDKVALSKTINYKETVPGSYSVPVWLETLNDFTCLWVCGKGQ